MGQPHLLTVILPVYNSERYLEACLSSILEQEGVCLEVIAVDDGSTDSSLKILHRIADRDKRITVIVTPNNGVNHARNLALERASGEYVAFCDSDDIVPAGSYRKLMEKALQGGYDVVIGAHRDCSDDGKSVLVQPKTKGVSPMDAFMQTCTIWERIVRREFIEQHQIRFEPYLGGGDVLFIAMLYRANPKTAFLTDSVYDYWHHTHDNTPSIANTRDLAHFADRLRCAGDLIERFPSASRQEAEEFIYLNLSAYFRTVLLRLRRGDELEQGFVLFRDFLQRFCWEQYPGELEKILGTAPEKLNDLSGLDYFRLVGAGGLLAPRDLVLKEFQSGNLGMRYLLAYAREWFHFKNKKRFRESPL